MPIVSTPGQQPISYSPITPPVPAAPVITDPIVPANIYAQTNPIAPIPSVPVVTDMPTYTQVPTVPAFIDPVVQQQPPATPSRLQNLMSGQMPVQAQPDPTFLPDNTTNFGSESDDEDPFDDESDDFGAMPQAPMAPMPGAPQKQQLSLSRMNEEQRRKTILDTFLLVLGKEPLDRDYSYYRFSTLTEEGLIKSLLALPEHKQMVDKAKEHTSLKQGMSDLDLRVKQLDTNLQSMQQELITLQGLLVEKNRYIQQMRGLPVDPQPVQQYAAAPLPSYAPPVAPAREPVQPVMQPVPVSAPAVPTKSMADVQVKTLPGPFDEMKSMLGSLFGKKN